MTVGKLSVFDLDHTLFSCNSSFRFGRHLYGKGHLTNAQLLRALFFYTAHKGFGLSLGALHTHLVPLFRRWTRDSIELEVGLFLDLYWEQLVRSSVYLLLKKAQAQGEKTLILSNSPSFLVKEIGRRCVVDESLGTLYGTDQTGHFSCVENSLESCEKAAYVKEAALRWNVSISQITAYSDSILDLPLLEFAGRSVAVAPDRYLRRIATKRKWMIVE